MDTVMTDREKKELRDAVARYYLIDIDDPACWGDLDPDIANNVRLFIEGYEYRCSLGNILTW